MSGSSASTTSDNNMPKMPIPPALHRCTLSVSVARCVPFKVTPNFKPLSLGCIECMRCWDADYCYRWLRCLSVTRLKSDLLCKNGWTDPYPLWGEQFWEPKEHYVRRRSWSPTACMQNYKSLCTPLHIWLNIDWILCAYRGLSTLTKNMQK